MFHVRGSSDSQCRMLKVVLRKSPVLQSWLLWHASSWRVLPGIAGIRTWNPVVNVSFGFSVLDELQEEKDMKSFIQGFDWNIREQRGWFYWVNFWTKWR